MDPTPSLRDPSIRELAKLLGEPIFTSTGEARFESPFSQHFKHQGKRDIKRHLYVNVRKGVFNCFKSGVAGSVSYLFRCLGLEEPDESAPPPVDQDTWGELRSRLKTLGAQVAFERPRAELPDWYQPVEAGSDVHQYLLGRGVTDEDIQFYSIGEGTGDYRGWAIIPSFDKAGICEYWVARYIHEKEYLNPDASHRRYHLGFLNQAMANANGHGVIVCEGVFSALAAGRDAVATYGKLVSQQQLTRLLEEGVKHVTLALDGDAWTETLDTARRALILGLKVSVLPLPLDQDPADMGREAFRQYLEENTRDVNEMELAKLQLLGV